MKSVVPIVALFAGAASALMHAQGTSGATGVAVKPTAVQKRAAAPPPASATKTRTVGKTAVKLNTPSDASFWVESMDIDGDGNVEDANLVWDDQNKVLFSYKDGTFTCKNGATGSGEMMIAVYGAGNTWKRPAGSGFFVAALDKDECAAKEAGLWGCRFNKSGNPTQCGLAALDEKTQDLVIAKASQ
jgi:hypothetical protein